jgi:DNA-binding CsgD family transcriptional regulator
MNAPPRAPEGALLERDRELDAVEQALRRVRAGVGRALVIDAPAGVGKTALLSRVRDLCSEAGVPVLHARGAELERGFAFGVIRQLFEPLGAERDPELFAGAARLAQGVLALEGAESAQTQDPFATRHALFWLTANLAARGPLAIVVDDTHWADAASLGALAHIAHRLDGLSVLLVVAARTAESGLELDAIRVQADADGTHLVLGPLGEAASADVVRALLPDADDALCQACHRASGGNPFLLHELVRSVAAGGDAHVEHSSPARVTRAIHARLGGLSPLATNLAGAAAILGGHASLREVTALTGIDAETAAPVADALIRAGVLGAVRPVEFLHPLIQTAVYEGLTPSTRALGHRRAARALAAQGAPPERIAAQLLRCHPSQDPWAVDELLRAAALAGARGSAEAAARYLERARQEPPEPERRAGVLLALGQSEALAGNGLAAIETLRELLAGDVPGPERLGATTLLAALLVHGFAMVEAADTLEAQAEMLADDPGLRVTADVLLTNICRLDPAISPRATGARRRLRALVDAGEADDAALLASVATDMVTAGVAAEETAAVARRALVALDRGGPDGAGWTAVNADWSAVNAARTLMMCDHFAAAGTVFERMLAAAVERTTAMDVGAALMFRAELLLRTGELTRAEVDARTVLELAEESGWRGGTGLASAWLVELLLEQGAVEEAGALLAEHDFDALARGYSALELRAARARLRLAGDDVEGAIADLRTAGRWAVGSGYENPSVTAWRSLLAGALARVGEMEEARGLAFAELERARAFGAPRALAIALRGAAAVAEDGVALLREAALVLQGSPARLELARTQFALGQALHAAGDAAAARVPLREAVDLAHACGASLLEQETLALLRATGARPRRPRSTGADALTPSERRIAELAAAGTPNRDIAQALFVTTNTVEYHLRNAYRKLAIASRGELADALQTEIPRVEGAKD